MPILHKLLSSLLLFTLLAGPAFAQANALERCLADGTTGKDRKELARWVFLAMAAHPEMKQLANATPAAVDESSRRTAALFNRLLADTCAKEVKAAMQGGGTQAIQPAFNVLGQLAMRELMGDKDVMGTMAVFERYIDQPRINAALGR